MTSDPELLYELTWVHLSDLHETGGRDSESQHRKIVLRRLLEDLSQRSEMGLPEPRVVVVTGDIAMTGGARHGEEYLETEGFLRGLAQALGPGTRIMTVPGNHDVQRVSPENPVAFRMVRSARDGSESIDDLLLTNADSEQLEGRLAPYRTFVNSLTDVDPEVARGSVLTGWSRAIDTAGLSIRFVGLNTSLLANDDSDQGKLRMGFTQLRTVTEGARAGEVTVVLTHHPFDWLADGEQLAPLVREYVDIHLYGHLHVPASARLGLLQRRGLIGLGAGATYHGLSGEGVGSGEYAYSVMSLGWNPQGQLMLRVWPRVWNTRAGRWGADSAILERGAESGTILLEGHSRHPDSLRGAAESSPAWRSWSARTLRQFGLRRTAYPLDLTIGELFDRSINIRTTVLDYVSEGGHADALTNSVGDRLGSVVVLGEPGAGKSVGAYELARALAKTGAFPVILKASEFKALLSPGHEYAEVMARALKEAGSWGMRMALVVDGLDEMSGSTNGITLAGNFLKTASEQMMVIATCRRREFEEEISRWMPSSTFDRILSVKEWTVDGEFSEYVRRLVGASLLNGTEILGVVRASTALSELATRPLFARMLTYVGATDSRAIESSTSLYLLYLDRLATSCSAGLRDAGFGDGVDVGLLWESAARLAFENRLIVDEQLNYSAVELFASRDSHLDSAAVQRAMAYVLDIHERGPVRYGQFVHYSFFEFLVAASLYRYLVSGVSEDLAILARRLQNDLPRRVRHFLTDLLGPAMTELVENRLLGVYRFVQQSDMRLPVRRTICNLVAYVLSRTLPGEVGGLRELLESEDDPFLRNSLLWAICHAGDGSGALQYVRELDSSAVMRQMNRGYLLYYHGDLSRDVEPPFLDAPPLRGWTFTKGEVLEMVCGQGYRRSVRPARQVIDLYTFFDFCIARGETIQGEDAEHLRRLVDEIWAEGDLPIEASSRVLAQAAVALSPG